ncbi:hypothetical protein F4825DRAFT_446352 [Nemania diffusa]|nr:hypothetical protein F4825DRAFT_446352 [Nemania diffusa]
MAAVNVQQQPQPGPQPDFQALSGSLQGTSVEVGRCSSLANQGITVQNAATQLTEQLESAISTLTQTLTQAINGLGDEMRQGMQDLRLSLDDFDYNNRARLQNSAVIRPESILKSLKNTNTHQVVQLPNTARELSTLCVAEVEHYLQQLGQVPVGNAEEKKNQLKEYIGINVGF